jgi:hypothetical protein
VVAAYAHRCDPTPAEAAGSGLTRRDRSRVDLKAERTGKAVDGKQKVRGTEQIVSGRIDPALVRSYYSQFEPAGSWTQPTISIEAPDLARCHELNVQRTIDRLYWTLVQPPGRRERSPDDRLRAPSCTDRAARCGLILPYRRPTVPTWTAADSC